MGAVDVVYAHGHPNIRSTNKSTFEITKEPTLTRRGECIIAVGATKGAAELHPEFKGTARREDAQITITIKVGGMREVVRAMGGPKLSFLHPTDLVVRKSAYVCGRTIAIEADKAAADFPRKLVDRMQNPHQKIMITLIVENLYRPLPTDR